MTDDTKSKKNSIDKRLANLIPWAKDPRTISNESKKAGRDRKKQWQEMMNKILKYQNMPFSDVLDLADNMEELWKLSLLEVTMIKYIAAGFKDNKMLVDMVNRHIWYAPAKIEIEPIRQMDPASQVLDQRSEDEIQDID